MNKYKIYRRLVAIIYIVIALAMAAGTVIEKLNGHENAASQVYDSGWFILLWLVLAVLGGIAVWKTNMKKSITTFVLHSSLALILIGALLTTFTGKTYELQLMKGESSNQLPFTVRLDDCHVVNHAGTNAAKNYTSVLTISEPQGENHRMEISVNHIGKYQHYRFYQMGYDPEGGSAIIVSHDPWGMGIVYAGFALLILTFAIRLLSPQGNFRQLMKRLTVLGILLIPASTMLGGTHSTLSRKQAAELGKVYVYYHDRVCPLQTMAYDVTNQLYGTTHYHGLTAEQVLSGWMFYPEEWAETPTKGGKHLADQQMLQLALLEQRIFKIYPLADSSTKGVVWYAPTDNPPLNTDDDKYLFVKHFLAYCQEQVFLGKTEQMDTLLAKMQRFQTQTEGVVLPAPAQLSAERAWNKLSYIKPLSMAVTTLGIILFAFFIYCMVKKKDAPKWVRRGGVIISALLSLYLLLLIILRWVAQQHVPMTNGFEMMIFLAFCLTAAAWLGEKRFSLMLPAGILMSGLALLVAMMSGGDTVMTQMLPVLQSPLLCIHVSVIMLSYMLLCFVFLIGLAALFCSQPVMERLQTISLLLIYPATFLLATGIIIGSVWANISWGCYWSWDPKEVWALITLMLYIVPLHYRSISWINRPRVYHLYCCLAFLSVLITYFGVNLLLGGMHSYA